MCKRPVNPSRGGLCPGRGALVLGDTCLGAFVQTPGLLPHIDEGIGRRRCPIFQIFVLKCSRNVKTVWRRYEKSTTYWTWIFMLNAESRNV